MSQFSHVWERIEPKKLVVLLVIVLAFIFFELFPTRSYAGDGLKYSPRGGQDAQVSGNNHLLTPLWVRWWSNLCAPWAGTDFEDQMTWRVRLNHLTGALSAGLVAALVLARAKDPLAAGLAGMLLPITTGFFQHATQGTETMMGLFWSLLAWRLLVQDEGEIKVWRVALSAACFAIGVASYQSYIFAGFGLALVPLPDWKKSLLWMMTCLVCGLLLFIGGAYGAGASDGHEVCRFLFNLNDGDYFTGIRIGRVPAVAVGLAGSVWPLFPDAWPGFRRGWAELSSGRATLLVVQVASILSLALAVIIAGWRAARRERKWDAPVIFFGALFAPFYFEPYYDKLWLLPLAALSVMAGAAMSARPFARYLAAGAALIILLVNIPLVFLESSRRDNLQVRTAAALEQSIKPSDLLVCDGWDATVRYLARHPEQSAFYMIQANGDRAALDRKIFNTQARGKRVFFFNVLERTREQWQYSFGLRHAFDYDACDAFRAHSRLIWSGEERRVHGNLYELEPAYVPVAK